MNKETPELVTYAAGFAMAVKDCKVFVAGARGWLDVTNTWPAEDIIKLLTQAGYCVI